LCCIFAFHDSVLPRKILSLGDIGRILIFKGTRTLGKETENGDEADEGAMGLSGGLLGLDALISGLLGSLRHEAETAIDDTELSPRLPLPTGTQELLFRQEESTKGAVKFVWRTRRVCDAEVKLKQGSYRITIIQVLENMTRPSKRRTPVFLSSTSEAEWQHKRYRWHECKVSLNQCRKRRCI
jgi:hypothetical protein